MVVDKPLNPLVVRSGTAGEWFRASRFFLATAILFASFAGVVTVAPRAPLPPTGAGNKRLGPETLGSGYELTAYSPVPRRTRAVEAAGSGHRFDRMDRARKAPGNGESLIGAADCRGHCTAAEPDIGARLQSGMQSTVAYLETDGGRNLTIAVCAIVSSAAALLTFRLKRAEVALTKEQNETTRH